MSLRILHIIPTYVPAYSHGGPVRSVHALNKWLVKKGVEVTVYTTNIDGGHYLNVPLGVPEDVDGVRVFYFPTSFRKWEYSLEMHRALAMNTGSFDLIHITSVYLSASTLGAYYARKHNIPYIISPRGSLESPLIKGKSFLLKRLYISLFERRNLRYASAVHFTTRYEQDLYMQSHFLLQKSMVIPNGLDVEDFVVSGVSKSYFRDKFGISKDKKIVLFLSRLTWKKGLDTLLRAFTEVLEVYPLAVLVVAGGDDGSYGLEMRALAHKLGIKDSVIFLGMLLGKDRYAAFLDADVFTLPSISENFAMVGIEAMYSKVPLVITPNVGIAREVSEYEAGLVVQRTSREIAEALTSLLLDDDRRIIMGEAGRRLVEEKFLAEKVAEKFIQAYKHVLS